MYEIIIPIMMQLLRYTIYFCFYFNKCFHYKRKLVRRYAKYRLTLINRCGKCEKFKKCTKINKYNKRDK